MKVFCVGKSIDIFHTGIAAYLCNDKLCIPCNFVIPPLLLLPELIVNENFTFDTETYPPKIVLLTDVPGISKFISIDRSGVTSLYYVFKKVDDNSYVFSRTNKMPVGQCFRLEKEGKHEGLQQRPST